MLPEKVNTTEITECEKIPDINWLISDALYRSIAYDTIHSRVHDTNGPCYHEIYFIAAFVLQWVNACLIISLNIAVIVTILQYKKRSRLYFLLLNLALADLVTGVIDTFPNAIEQSLGFGQTSSIWLAGDFMCKLYKLFSNMSIMASNYILVVTSIDRAMVVYKPMINFKRGHIWQKCMVVGCWVVSFTASLPILNIASVTQSNHCAIAFEDDTLYSWKILISYMFVVIFAIPFVIIVISYTILIVSVYRQSFNTTKYRLSQVFNRAVPRTKTKSLKFTVAIVLSFILSWSLFFVFMFLQFFKGYYTMMMMIFVTCYYWNCIANPVLFFIFHRRKARSGSAFRSFYSIEHGHSSKTNSTDVLIRSSKNNSAELKNVSTLLQSRHTLKIWDKARTI